MSGMSNSPLETHYPHGSTSKAKGGRGIFVDNVTGDGLEVWVDVHLRDRSDVLRSLEVSYLRPHSLIGMFLPIHLHSYPLHTARHGRAFVNE